MSNLIQMPFCSMQTRILANAELTRFGFTIPPAIAQGGGRDPLRPAVLIPQPTFPSSAASSSAHHPPHWPFWNVGLVLLLLTWKAPSQPAPPTPLCKERVPTSPARPSKPSDPIPSQDPLPRHPTCCFMDILPDP